MPHPRKKHKKAFTLIEMAIVLVIIGLIAVLIFPAITDFIKFGKKTEAKDFVDQVKKEIIGYALMTGGCLPDNLSDLGVSTDAYGEELLYWKGTGLDCTSDKTIDDYSSTDLTVKKEAFGGGVTTYDDIAFVIASKGRNVHQEFEVVSGSTIVTIYDPRQWPSSPNYDSDYDEYDDIVEYVSLAYLKNKVGTNVSGSFEPPGSDVSFAKNFDDFVPGVGGSNDPDYVTTDADTQEVTLGDGVNDGGSHGCIWYQGANTVGNCTDGRCSFGNGTRVFFNFEFSGTTGSGFTFAIVNANATSNNDVNMCGGNMLGYSGGDPINPPKLASEFDIYSSGGDGDGDPNAAAGLTGPQHMALVFWGEGSSGAGAADDNNQCGGTNGTVTTDWENEQGKNPPYDCPDLDNAPCTYWNSEPGLTELGSRGEPGEERVWAQGKNTGFYYNATAPGYNFFMDGEEHSFRMDVKRSLYPNDSGDYYNCTINVCMDCNATSDLTQDYENHAWGNWNTGQAYHWRQEFHRDVFTGTDRVFLGWTVGTGGGNLQVTISDFGLAFRP